MTANAFDEDKKLALDAGMNGHIAKPIDVSILLEVLQEVLQ
jgi:CheY-like chemotaxis protein